LENRHHIPESNFLFLQKEYPLLANIGQSAEYYLHSESLFCLIKLRLWGEKLSELISEIHGLETSGYGNFANRLKTLAYEGILPTRISDLLYAVKEKGNKAVHENKGSKEDALALLQACFNIAKWFSQVYSTDPKVAANLSFQLPPANDARHALHLLEQDYQDLEDKFNNLLAEHEITTLDKSKADKLKTLSAKVAEGIELSEAETREIIDRQIRQSGWEADTNNIRYSKGTRPEKGKCLAIAEWPIGKLKADYAFFIGLELYAIAEAKKNAKDIISDLGQAKIYSKAAEGKFEAILLKSNWKEYKVPFMFAANGREFNTAIETKSGIWFLDGRSQYNHPRPLRGWYSPQGLQDLLNRNEDEANKSLVEEPLDYLTDKSGLNLRQYQLNAIEAVETEIRNPENEKRALVAMATGTGKTRTIIGLCYRLLKSKRFKRMLFLVDRSILGKQAADSFKDVRIDDLLAFASIYDIADLKDKKPDIDTKLHFATVQGMVKRIYYSSKESHIPPVDTYDCIIIDEAHRGYTLDKEMEEEEVSFKDQKDFLSKYKMVLDYFDAFRIGLTATPALHTTEIFGHPVYRYSYRQAVIDGFLIDHEPPINIKTKLNEEGITWVKGEKPNVWNSETKNLEELDELADEITLEVEKFNKAVITENFNKTVAGYLVQELDPDGMEKTLVFAATDQHADLVVKVLKKAFRDIGVMVDDDAILKITGNTYNPQELVTKFKNERLPNIVVTVDLLSTGIDVPEICNLVFLRRVKSRILYEQMLGRATRRADHINKEVFRIFDAVRIYEALAPYTDMKPVVAQPKISFEQLIEELDKIKKEERQKVQIEQILAKLHRNKAKIQGKNEEAFLTLTDGKEPNEYIDMLKGMDTGSAMKQVQKDMVLYKLLDEMKGAPVLQFFSDHPDEYRGIERGYGKAIQPDDYIESFRQFIFDNREKNDILKLLCTRPSALTRKELKNLMLELDLEGYSATQLNTAWKESKNEDMAADIISYIRALALGTKLISHEMRIRQAMRKVREGKIWTKIQSGWLDRFEKQLLSESIIDKESLESEPFKSEGGYDRLNKIFELELDNILIKINENLYADAA
jgi:type I restriction enzyme R subunit